VVTGTLGTILIALGILAVVSAIMGYCLCSTICSTGKELLKNMKKERIVENRHEYIEKLKVQIQKWENKLTELRSKTHQVEEKAKAEYKKRIDSLQLQLKEAGKRLKEGKEASSETWENIEEKTKHGWDDLKESIEKAFSKFKN
jgi:dynactin complex subunit